MVIGIPRETKIHEFRVGMNPTSVREAVHHGHHVLVERHAGHAIGLDDDDYRQAGAQIAADAGEVFAGAELIVKVKEPQSAELALLREGQVLFTYLHLAPDPEQTRALMESGCVAVAYETVTDAYGGLPLLAPMSEVAGRMSVLVGAHCLELEQGGRGVLLGGVAGVPAADVTILGGGVVGTNAARMAMGSEARVTVIDKNLHRLKQLDHDFGPMLNTLYATVDAVERAVLESDLVIGAVLAPGAATPKLVSEELVRGMRRGAVLVDVAIDQGGCFATSRPTSHVTPTYRLHDVVHYCVTNMPAAMARTATFALNNATLPFALALADRGYRQAMRDDPHLCAGLNVHSGQVTCLPVAESLGLPYQPADRLVTA